MLKKEDIILASYPKCGNTWVKFLLFNIFNPNKELSFDGVNTHYPSIDSPKELSKHIHCTPQVYKTHDVYKHYYDKNKTIFIIRHIGDVLISYYHFQIKYFNIDIDLDTFLLNDNYGSGWRNMIDSWYNRCSIFIRYEDMINDTNNELSRILDTLEMTCNKAEIQNAVNKCSFNSMRHIEETKGLGETDIREEGFFMRKGQIGQWITDLTDEQKNKLIENNIKYLKLYNYEKK